LLLFFMVLAWYTLKALFPQKPKLWWVSGMLLS
jgi:hypothetical protein